MKKFLLNLAYIFLFVLVALFFYFRVPQSARLLHQRINQSNPNILDDQRLQLSQDYADFLAADLPKDPGQPPTLLHLFIGKQRSLINLRLQQALQEIQTTPVASGHIRIWSMINMGVVAKTSNKIIAFDVADMPLSQAQKPLARIADVFVVSHGDTDHYDTELLKQALANNKQVAFLEGLELSIQSPNMHSLTSGQPIDLDGVKVTAFQTDHRLDRSFIEPSAWLLVEVDGFKLLHTGDGVEFKNKTERQHLNQENDIDIFLVNAQIHPYDIRDIHPHVAVPLHLYKFVHNREELGNSTFNSVMSIYAKYPNDLKGIPIEWLFNGESSEYPLSKN